MTDEKYVFTQTIKERNAIKSGARHKKCGSKSKKCTLPGDYLTKKEKENMNGPISTYKIKGASRTEFQSYPADIRQMIIDEHAAHGARLIDIAKHLNWGGCDTAFAKWCSQHGVKNTCKPGRKPKQEYLDWLGDEYIEIIPIPVSDPAIDIPAEPPKPVKKAPSAGTIKYSGSIEEIAANLIDLLSGEEYTITVNFEKKIELFKS